MSMTLIKPSRTPQGRPNPKAAATQHANGSNEGSRKDIVDAGFCFYCSFDGRRERLGEQQPGNQEEFAGRNALLRRIRRVCDQPDYETAITSVSATRPGCDLCEPTQNDEAEIAELLRRAKAIQVRPATPLRRLLD